MPSIGSAVLELFAKLGLDSSEYDEKLKSSEKDANKFASSFKTALSTAAKVGAAAFGVASAAVTKFGTEAVESYAEYEQLVGGVQKLYGNAGRSLEEYAEANGKAVDEVRDEWQKLEDAQNQVLKNAQQAYITSGMSMNEYMETATSFSASLIKSLGGDTQEAARVTDIAMRAISDNVNTFGSDIEAVSNAIMGLSRNNYMMIDNLKLGYAGTAQGMLELINDSGVLNEKLTDTKQLADVGFATMINAIQAIQEQQGIAGTTAREAMQTIEGSANATKAAWQNLITTIGKGEGLNSAIDDLINAVFGGAEGGGLLNNVLPRVQTVMEGIGDFVGKASPFISKKLPELVDAILPSLISASFSMLEAFAQAIPGLFETAQSIIMNEGLGMIRKLSEGFVEGIPEFLSKALLMLVAFTGELRNNIGTIVDAGINLIMNFVQGIVNAMPELIAYIPEIVINIAGIINDNLPKIIEMGIQVIISLISGIISNIPNLIANAGKIVEAIVSVISAFNWLNLGKNLLTLFTNGIKAIATMPVNTIRNIGQNIFNVFKNGFSWGGLGRAIIDGIVSGIRGAGGAIRDTLMGFAHSAFNAVKSFFGIASPSKLMRDKIGKFIPEGIAVGIDANADAVKESMEGLSDIAVNGFATNGIVGDNSGNTAYHPANITLNIYGAEGQDIRELAEIIMDEINRVLNSRRSVYA